MKCPIRLFRHPLTFWALPINVVREYGFLPLVRRYPAQINQIFNHILSNAVDALLACKQDKRTIQINTELDSKGFACVAIQDNGMGIPEAVQDRIFDPFFTTKPVRQGTGLGLAIAYQILEEHRGLIDLKSDVGKGTTFTLCVSKS